MKTLKLLLFCICLITVTQCKKSDDVKPTPVATTIPTNTVVVTPPTNTVTIKSISSYKDSVEIGKVMGDASFSPAALTLTKTVLINVDGLYVLDSFNVSGNITIKYNETITTGKGTDLPSNDTKIEVKVKNQTFNLTSLKGEQKENIFVLNNFKTNSTLELVITYKFYYDTQPSAVSGNNITFVNGQPVVADKGRTCNYYDMGHVEILFSNIK
jgi:hypothetical protein